MMVSFAEAAVRAASITDGLVDPTLVTEVEQAGYPAEFSGTAGRLAPPFSINPARQPAAPSPTARWRQVAVDRRHSTITRPVGVLLDSGDVGEGLFGDVLASLLSWYDSFAVEASGDIRFGGAAAALRPIQVASPYDDRNVLHTFKLVRGAAATSGISKRTWVDDRGRLAHHLLDPATGRPAFTGVVQATALAPSGVEAEALAKAALLSGPRAAARWLRHGGVVVYDDGTHRVIESDTGEVLR
jgi:FAD:protein FMN transferase